MCRVRDSKEYQAFLTGPCGSKSKAKKTGKGKETMPPPSNLADSDNLPNPADDADIAPVDTPDSSRTSRQRFNIVSLTSIEERLAEIAEEDVDFTNAEAAAEWQNAHERAATRAAELTWSKKALADAKGREGVFKDYESYL